jgi:GTP-binding protein YchF
MRVGLAGMPLSGKSTIFRALTGLPSSAESGPKGKPFPGVLSLPDARLEKLGAYYKPKKVTPLQMQVFDIPGPGPVEGEEQSRSLPPRFVADMRTMDVLCAVVKGFDESGGGAKDLCAQMRSFREEMILQDFDVAEKKWQRLAKGEKESFNGEKDILGKIKDALESERDVASLGLPDDTLRALSGYAFLTLKPLVYILNMSESRPPAGGEMEKALEEGGKLGAPVVPLFGRLELDVLELDEAGRKEFLKDAGLEESGLKGLIGAIGGVLKLITFFTAVGEELRAWGIGAGTSIVRAAGKIHTDMEKGFIKADVMSFDDFSRLGSEASCRKEGKLRQEGKSYIVQDGDIIAIKFNV